MNTFSHPLIRLSLALALAFVSLSTVKAEVKRFAFSGMIGEVANPNFLLDGSITPGSSFEGYYTFDSAAVDTNPGDPTVGDYYFGKKKFGVVIKAGNYVFRTNPEHVSFLIEIVDRPTDNYLFRSYNNICSKGLSVESIGWQLDDPTGTAFTSDSLPATPPDLTVFQSPFGVDIFGFCNTFFIRGTITSIVDTAMTAVEQPIAVMSDAVEVKWPSRLGVFYQVQASSDLQTWLNVEKPLLGDGKAISKFFPHAAGKNITYRVRSIDPMD